MSQQYKIVNGVYKGPEHFKGPLDLKGTQVTSLGVLKSVGGFLDLRGTQVTSLGSLERVGGWLDIKGTQVTSLGTLESVGEFLYLGGTQVTDFGALKSVGGNLNLRDTRLTSLGVLKRVGLKITFSQGESYTWKEYQELISNFERNTDVMDYPLYINDSRTPIRLLVLESFKKES